jgi:site-specific recombinase XerD
MELNTTVDNKSRIQPLKSLHLLWPEFHNKLKLQEKSENTLKNYKTDMDCFKRYLEDSQGHDGIEQLELSKVLEYGKYLETKYSSNNSRRRRVQTLRIFFDFLVENSIITSNPVRKIPTSPKFVDIPRPTKFVDVKTLWLALISPHKTSGKLMALIQERNQVIFLLIYHSGLKVSDLAKIQVNQLSLGSHPRVLITPVSRDPYSIPLSTFATKIIKKYLTLLEQEKVYSNITFTEMLFNANPHKILSGGLSSRGIEIIMEDYRRKLSIEVTPKSLRQASIINWINKGHNDTTVKEWMGVAPSYSLKNYRDVKDEYFYNDQALEELYEHRKN